MVNACVVPNCKTGYKDRKNKTIIGGSLSTFTVPSDHKLRKQWARAIPRKDFVLTSKAIVCELHFKKEEVISHKEVDYGTHKEYIKLKKNKLRDGAIPSIWPSKNLFLLNLCLFS